MRYRHGCVGSRPADENSKLRGRFFFLCVSERWTALWHVVLGLYTSLKAVNICVKK